MKHPKLLFGWGCLLFVIFVNVVAAVSVNPKLEFVDDNQKDSMAPKIQGVRVIVDTSKINSKIGETDEQAGERTESIKINANGNGKQTVGIRTDITFEISDDKNETKSEGREAGGGNDDDEVPIIRSGDGIMYADDGAPKADERIDFNVNNRPIYHRTDDEKFDGTGGTWVNFFPMTSAWTTERNFFTRNNDQSRNMGFIPYTINDRSFKPCICANEQSPWRGNGINRRAFLPQGRQITNIDDKLEYPFSNLDKRKRK